MFDEKPPQGCPCPRTTEAITFAGTFTIRRRTKQGDDHEEPLELGASISMTTITECEGTTRPKENP